MDPGEPALLFRNVPAEVRPGTSERRVLRTFAADLSQRVAAGRPFNCLITGDTALRKLNREFLGHDYATDVLSFPAASAGELGDLAISAERAHAQAETYGHTLLDELRVLMLHGVLHLVGFDHESDRGEMKRAERKWRVTFNLPTTLIARVNGAAKR
jgi:probable rRNA maturation factor